MKSEVDLLQVLQEKHIKFSFLISEVCLHDVLPLWKVALIQVT
jgi:hypothetical protein